MAHGLLRGRTKKCAKRADKHLFKLHEPSDYCGS